MRASNRAGQGLWSAPLDVISGAGAPDKPKEPRAQARPGGTSALVTWEQPINNGAIITGYRSVDFSASVCWTLGLKEFYDF